MTKHRMARRLTIGMATAWMAIAMAQPSAPTTVRADRLDRLSQFMQDLVDRQQIPGTVMLVSRGGQVFYSKAMGTRDPSSTAPMTTDSIFRMYSMTKAVTSVAAMLLVEDGRIALADPVTRYLPELRNLKVAKQKTGADGAPATDLVPAKRPATIQDLMRHTGGWTAPGTGSAVEKMYHQALLNTTSSSDFVTRVAALPLVYEPGTRWEYSISHDLLGAIIERVEGKTLDVFMRERIFGPLRMPDTGFVVAEASQARIAEAYPADPVTKEKLEDFSDPRRHVGFAAGGGYSTYGADILVSTAPDFHRFLLMLLNGGALDGVRILSRKSVELITADHLKGIDRPASFTGEASGWALLGARVRNTAGVLPYPGSVGEYFWGGYGGTYFIVDPAEKLIAIRMSQAPWSRSYDSLMFRTLIYSSLP